MEYIKKLGGSTELKEVHGKTLAISPLGDVQHVSKPIPAPLNVNTLSGLVEYLKSGFDKESSEVLINIESPTHLSVVTKNNEEAERTTLMHVQALTPNFRYDNWYDTEEFNIKMQSVFVKNEDSNVILKVVGNIKEENVRQTGDNGTSQMVTAKTGVGSVDNVIVPNPVVLAPYRTFTEVEQPLSSFVFRMRTGRNGVDCALFEADGGAWKLQAKANIKQHLEQKLRKMITAGKVNIIS